MKRDREESTPASGSSQQPQAKRQRVDSPEIEEISEEVLDLNALKKRLKLLPTEHPQIAELQKEKEADEQLDLIM